MKNIRDFLSENFQFLEVKFSIYLNRHVFVMEPILKQMIPTPIPKKIGLYISYDMKAITKE